MKIEMVDPQMAAALRRMTERQRLEIAAGMFRSARQMLMNLMRAEHPEWTEQQVTEEVARRFLQGVSSEAIRPTSASKTDDT